MFCNSFHVNSLHISLLGVDSSPSSAHSIMINSEIKAGWSLLATLHCCMLPDSMKGFNYRPPLLHILARRWQDRCLEVCFAVLKHEFVPLMIAFDLAPISHRFWIFNAITLTQCGFHCFKSQKEFLDLCLNWRWGENSTIWVRYELECIPYYLSWYNV